MEYIFTTTDPMLLFLAIVLTFMASYTAIDLFTLINSSDRNKEFLFLGGVTSMGIGIWVMNVLVTFTINTVDLSDYNIPLEILSVLLGIIFIGIAFYNLVARPYRTSRLYTSSFFLTLAVFCFHVLGVYSMNYTMSFDPEILFVSLAMIFISFLFSLWILFSKKYSYTRRGWLRPVSTLIITLAIVEGYFLLSRASSFYNPRQMSEDGGQLKGSFVFYIVIFMSVLILTGLIVTSTLVSKRLASSYTNLQDFKFALDQSSIVAMTDRRGRIIYANDKFCEISKYSRDELIGQDHRILNSGYHPKSFFKDLWKTIGTGHVWKGEICNRAKDGSFYWVNTTIVPFLDNTYKPYQYIAIRTDITERKRTEEYLHRQDKLAAVGQLAAGVAHEIRNPLTSMQGYAEFLTLDEKDEQRKEFLEIILDEINRVDDILEDFMVLARPKDLTMETGNIVLTVQNVLSLLDYDARQQNVSVSFENEQDSMQVVMDENRMKQVFLNLVKNAIEAMPEGGDLSINIDYDLEREQRWVHIKIADSGMGISEKNLKKISNPFYTTKENGNGLGLMISYKIVENLKGKIHIDSAVGEGTTFHVYLPAAERK
ncbi:PAS domain S-box protein [Virgibacillus sp. MSP4-1]|uniref:ATP-binding protein n=1 Tax=Virgibacillus sp. MSP4-1 TaxID=2700081 RepID=UPI00039F1160|nr:ATP-binding protein [Virgibacillus sp. MSP4-1]QHS22508.1 PAS domain S-box protein [Virgibacillus sp. MSP4-1]